MAKILVLEDEKDFGNLLTKSLEQAGHSVTLTEDATEALATFQNNSFDFVVADLIVKKGDEFVADGGLLLISRIRQHTRASNSVLPIVAISGSTKYPGLGSVLKTAESLGANVSLEKPFHPNELLDLIDDLLPAGATQEDET